MAYEGDGWQEYDRIFKQHTAVRPSCKWAKIDSPLRSVVFAGKTMASHCKYCFSFSHASTECAWATNHSTQREPLSLCHQTTDNAIAPLPILGNVGEEFASHGVTPLTQGVLFPTVPLNILVYTVLITLSLWINAIKQDSVLTKAQLNKVADLITITNDLTDFRLYAWICRYLLIVTASSVIHVHLICCNW